MRARISDTRGPRLRRAVPYLGFFALFCFGCFGPLQGGGAAAVALGSVAAFHAWALFPHLQRKMQTAELVLGPGRVAVKKSDSRNQKIVARQIVGASTTRTPNGFALSLAHAGREQPVTLELDSEADVAKVRAALGIGHGGFGTVTWATVPSSNSGSGRVGFLLALIVSLVVTGLVLVGATEAAVIVSAILGPVGVIGSMLGFGSLVGRGNEPSIVMTAEGLRLYTKMGWFILPYGQILGIEKEPNALVFRVPPPFGAVAVECASHGVRAFPDHERDILVAQIEAAAARARGLGPQKPDVESRVDVLRRNGQNPRDWLSRLDMQGRMLASGAQGYRGNNLDTDDLWAIVEDPEADAELRTAASRVLYRSAGPVARVRIDAAAAAVRDSLTHARIRVALQDDLDRATEELADIDAKAPLAKALAQQARRF